jgi:RHS repeat-associated protein
MNARYQDPVRGQFISEDRAVVNLGSGPDLLRDPQQLNLYSYGRDNPIRYTDPTGDYTAAQNAAIANVFAAFGVTTPNAAQSSAIGNLALSFGVPAPLITNLAGGSYGSTPAGYVPASSGVSSTANGAAPAVPSPVYYSAVISNAVSTPQTPTGGNLLGFPGRQSHFNRHGDDFGAQTPDEYPNMAEKFLQNSPQNPNVQVKYNADQNTLRAYDPTTNTFGSYDTQNSNVRTYRKPDLNKYPNYWESQSGEAMSTEELITLMALILPK